MNYEKNINLGSIFKEELNLERTDLILHQDIKTAAIDSIMHTEKIRRFFNEYFFNGAFDYNKTISWNDPLKELNELKDALDFLIRHTKEEMKNSLKRCGLYEVFPKKYLLRREVNFSEWLDFSDYVAGEIRLENQPIGW